MAFDPDAYLTQKKEPAFDPDAYLASTKPKEETGNRSAEAALEGFGQEATFGYLPQLQAVAEPVITKIMDFFTGQDVSKDLPDYTQRRDENIQRIKQLEEENPGAFTAGRVGGGLATTVGGAGLLGKGLKGAGLVTKAPTSLLGRGAQAAATGGAGGFIMNPGDVEGEAGQGFQFDERLENAKSGALLGGLLLGAGELGSGVLDVGKKSVQGLKSFAENRAFKAAGPMLRDIKQANKKFSTNDYGREILDQGLLKGDSSFGAIAEKASQVRDQAGERIGNVVDKLDAATKVFNESAENVLPMAKKLGVKTIKVGDEIKGQLTALEGVPGSREHNKKLDKFIRDFKKGKNDVIGIKEAQALKEEAGKRINWKRDPRADIPENEARLRALYSSLKQGIEDTLDEASQRAGSEYGDVVSNAFKKDKKTYGIMSDIADISKRQEERQLANRFLSPSDYALGIGSGVGGLISSDGDVGTGLKSAAVGFGLNRGARLLTSPLVARGADALAKGAEKTLLPLLDNRFTKVLSDAIKENPEKLGLLGQQILGGPKTPQLPAR